MEKKILPKWHVHFL